MQNAPYVYRVGPLTCTDGTVTGMSSSITTGTPATYAPGSFLAGFPAVYTGSFIGGLTVRSGSGQDLTFGTPGGWGDAVTQPPTLCPAGSYLAGVFGKTSSEAVVSIGPICRAAGELPFSSHAASAAGCYHAKS